MNRTAATFLAAGAAAAVGLPAALAVLASPAAGAAQPAGHVPTAAARARTHPVVFVGIGGLTWSDLSATRTPAIWRLAGSGSVGSLSATTINPVTCPGDAWLTLNAGARATMRHGASGPCPALPAVVPSPNRAGARSGSAAIPALPGLIRYNNASFSYDPDWGFLSSAVPPGRCATAVGPGAALALASPAGQIHRYVPGVGAAIRYARKGISFVRPCALTVIDLGALPAGGHARAAAVRADDRAVARIIAAAPAGSISVLAGTGDSAGPSPSLHALIVAGPGYPGGLLAPASTRQPGVATITDLAPSIYQWLRGRPVPSAVGAVPTTGVIGSYLARTGRGPLGEAVASLLALDTASQVDRSTVGWFLLIYSVAEGVLFGAIAIGLRGTGQRRVRRRVTGYTAAAALAAGIPAGTFLAGLAHWSAMGHPAIGLYGTGLAIAALLAALAMAGPWRRQPFGPPGFVAAVTLTVIAIDLMTGSRLQPGAPFGLSLLEANRFYGLGNNAVGIYATAGIVTAAWAAATVLRRGRNAVTATAAPGGPPSTRARRFAVLAAGAVAAVAVFMAAWPGFGAKVGGTIAMVPAFLLLIAAIGGIRVTAGRGVLIAASGLAVITVFAVTDYLFRGQIGASHLSTFVGQVLHGGAASTLNRKVGSNLASLTGAALAPAVPVLAVVTAALLAWPARLRLRLLAKAGRRDAVLRGTLAAIWLAAVLGWFADDNGVRVPAMALPFAFPLAIALIVRVGHGDVGAESDRREVRYPDVSPAIGRIG